MGYVYGQDIFCNIIDCSATQKLDFLRSRQLLDQEKMKNCRQAMMVFLVLLIVPGCSQKTESAAGHKPVIRVDGNVLTLAEFNEFFEPLKMSYATEQGAVSTDIAQARLRFLLQLLEEMIVLRRAEELRLSISPEELREAVGRVQREYSEESFKAVFMKQAISVETWQERLRRQLLVEKVIGKELLAQISATPKEISKYYDEHREEWTRGEQIKARQILLPTKEKANRVLKQLKKGEDFAALARLYSVAPEAAQGGDMGYVVRGGLPKSLEDQLFALPQGKVSRVTKTPFGYHIFEVTEKKRRDESRIDGFMERIRGRIQKEKLAAAYGPWLAKLRSRYKVVVNNEII